MAFAVDKLLAGDRRTLARAITLVESRLESHRSEAQEILESILPHTGNSIRLGISGVPGVGKSTFIEAFGQHVIGQGKRVAVLAVDPSSPVAGGSILGDKTRMVQLSRNPDAFIRPSPTGGTVGGVAQKTRETMLLCEAAGYDLIVVETVGVGQSEYQVAAMVDFFLVLMLPGGGDELQGIKKGILELADALVVNKADGDSRALANQACQHYLSALKLLRHTGFWRPRVMSCSSLENRGIDAVWDMVSEYHEQATRTNSFEERRARQYRDWMHQLVQEMLLARLHDNPELRTLIPQLETEVQARRMTAYAAASRIVEKF